MLYGARTQSRLLAEDLRYGARQAADRDRTRRTADPVTVERGTAPRSRTRRPLRAALLRHVRPAPATHAPAR